MNTVFRPCVVIPTLDNSGTLRAVVEGVREHMKDVIVVDDGSGPAGRAVVDALAEEGLARVLCRAENGGKGAAVIDGLRLAGELGFSHALQVDADGQHDLRDIPRFLAAGQAHPTAFVTGRPVYDSSAPASRRIARIISMLWVDLETGGPHILDPLCGFRLYPVESTLAARPKARRMGHDPEVAVKLYWLGAPIVNIDTRITYPPDGVSHYHLIWDNLEMTWTHTRLCLQTAPRLALRWFKWGWT